jgi:hypothetical protein
VARAKGAVLELVRGWRLEGRTGGAGALRPIGCDDGHAPRVGIATQLAAQPVLEPSAFSMNGRIRSIGAGKTIVVD